MIRTMTRVELQAAMAVELTRRTRTVTVYETYFLEEDVHDGDFPRDDVRTTVHECEDVEDAVRILEREGLSFAETGGAWAAHPDGSRITDYGTGQRVETSAHLDGWSVRETRAIVHRIG